MGQRRDAPELPNTVITAEDTSMDDEGHRELMSAINFTLNLFSLAVLFLLFIAIYILFFPLYHIIIFLQSFLS